MKIDNKTKLEKRADEELHNLVTEYRKKRDKELLNKLVNETKTINLSNGEIEVKLRDLFCKFSGDVGRRPMYCYLPYMYMKKIINKLDKYIVCKEEDNSSYTYSYDGVSFHVLSSISDILFLFEPNSLVVWKINLE